MEENIPTSMFAWRKHRGSAKPVWSQAISLIFVWEEVPVPETPSTGVLCKMLASGVCRSDHYLLALDDNRPWFQERFTLGHEGCGRIVRMGNDTQGSEFKIGDIVAMHAVPGCGKPECSECSRDLSQLCERCHHSGIGQDGFYAPYAAVDIRALVLVPESVSLAEAAVATDAVTTAYHAIRRRGEVKKTETIFLFGLGGLGFNALQILHAIGARVIVSDLRENLLKDAAKLGIPKADLIFPGQPVQEFVNRNGLAGKIDTVLDFVGTHQTFEDAQQIVRRGRKLVCIGTLNTENTIHMKLGIRKRLSIIFSYGGQVSDLQEILQHLATGSIKPQVEYAILKDFPAILKDLTEGKIQSRVALMHEEAGQE
ncbi:chaperonin 10-like protein [Coniella lustricola]|uniref:Chaperonin 10-like protein n=1 Tax=Coniella lustricola TaxID=2025994 RepID=A0A2T3A0H8_9PEZI|nr:chaperonin 10-like protein [Coniella lustricola]